MDTTRLDSLRSQLDEDRTLQLEFLEEHGADPYGEEVRDLGVGNDGFADSAQATEERSEVLGQIEASRLRVHRIDEALERMEAGTYGECSVCGGTIPAERLEIRPLSIRCVRCADRNG
jgi:RNA polymerase-binding transcription factor DksA